MTVNKSADLDFSNTNDHRIGSGSMPGLARKLLIFAAVDGLILQPVERGYRPAPTTKIAYKDNGITQVGKNEAESEKPGSSFEAFGIVGG